MKKKLRPFRLADLVRDRIPGQLTVSKDGSLVAMAVADALPDLSRKVSRVWLLDAGAPEGARPVTTRGTNASMPRFSPDGNHLAYLSERDNHTTQLVVLSRPFAEPRALTDFREGVRFFRWMPDSRSLLVIAPPDLPPAKKKALDRKDDGRDVETDELKARMWLVRLGPGKPRPLGPANLHVRTAAVSPDGRHIAFIVSDHPRLSLSPRRARLSVLDVATGGGRLLHAVSSGAAADMLPAWSPDGKRIAFNDSPRRGQLGPDYVFVAEVATRRLTRIDRAADRVNYLPHWLDNDTLVFVQQRGTRRIIRAAPASGRPGRNIVDLPGYVHDFTIAPGGKAILFSYSENDKPAEVYHAAIPSSGPAKCLTRVNSALARVRHQRGEVVRWKSKEGWDVEGLFWRPSSRSKSPHATVVIPHGGPHAGASNAHDPLSQLLCANGYAVFLPNFRGSTGYSERFFRAVHRDWGRGPADDILRGR